MSKSHGNGKEKKKEFHHTHNNIIVCTLSLEYEFIVFEDFNEAHSLSFWLFGSKIWWLDFRISMY